MLGIPIAAKLAVIILAVAAQIGFKGQAQSCLPNEDLGFLCVAETDDNGNITGNEICVMDSQAPVPCEEAPTCIPLEPINGFKRCSGSGCNPCDGQGGGIDPVGCDPCEVVASPHSTRPGPDNRGGHHRRRAHGPTLGRSAKVS